ncbi:MAG: thioredoxin domain-containing protein, partial [Candidatus Saccharimonas aalborgensis]
MTTKSWIIFSVLCVAILGGLVWVSRGDRIDVTDIDPSTVQPALSKNGQIADHTYGNMNSKVVLIEYGDYQCPGCGSAAPVIKKVVDKYKDKIGFVFRNFPLYEKHPNAFAASATAEAAGLQGKYWEMHEKLYANQDAWSQLSGV